MTRSGERWGAGEGVAEWPRYAIKPYDPPRHLAGCARTLREAFAHNHWPFWTQASPRLAPDYMRVMAALCDLRLVVEEVASGEARGAVMALAPASLRSWRIAAAPLARLVLQSLLGLYFFRPRAVLHLVRFGLGYLAVFRGRPGFTPHFEIAFLAVQPALAGQGWGRRLMDECLEELGRRNAARVVVLTDSTMSWGFYEQYGFRRILDVSLGGAYRIALDSVDERGFAYELDVQEKRAAMDIGLPRERSSG
jgi:ribosomal protein S18 acetylase RimI-like enzyme